jgi:molybdopterin/thiamine biosynthesis adenylyltransferase
MTPLVVPAPPLTPAQAARYARHLSLPGFGSEAQRRLRAAKVLVVGAGGLGAPVLQYLTAAGVGQITVIDDDVVETSNLQRQVLHRQEDLGRPKALSACDAMLRLDPEATVRPIVGRLGPDNALELFAAHDLVIDGSDNFATRYLSNDAAEITGTPLVWGTIFRFDGQVSVFWPGQGPMLRDLFPDIPPADSVPNCAEGGVLGALCGTIGSTMATEAVKVICGIGEPLVGRLMIHDALTCDYRFLRLSADPSREPVTRLADDYAGICEVPGLRGPRASARARSGAGAWAGPDPERHHRDTGRGDHRCRDHRRPAGRRARWRSEAGPAGRPRGVGARHRHPPERPLDATGPDSFRWLGRRRRDPPGCRRRRRLLPLGGALRRGGPAAERRSAGGCVAALPCRRGARVAGDAAVLTLEY